MSEGKIFNYSKWDNIDLSDDEKDCHPNIDKESWFRMKHRGRLGYSPCLYNVYEFVDFMCHCRAGRKRSRRD